MLGWSGKASWRRWREEPLGNDSAYKKGITESVTWAEVRGKLRTVDRSNGGSRGCCVLEAGALGSLPWPGLSGLCSPPRDCQIVRVGGRIFLREKEGQL